MGRREVHTQGRSTLPGGEKSRIAAPQLSIAEGLWGQLYLIAFPIVLKMLLATNHHDDSLATSTGPAKATGATLTPGHRHQLAKGEMWTVLSSKSVLQITSLCATVI